MSNFYGNTNSQIGSSCDGYDWSTRSPSFIQLYDRVYTNHLIKRGQYLNLSNQGIDPAYKNGLFTLTKTSVKNDTLNIFEPGIYRISVELDTSFDFADPPPRFGSVYTINYSLINDQGEYLTQMFFRGIVPRDATSTMPTTLNRNFLWEVKEPTYLRIRLCEFDFDLSLVRELYAYNIILYVEKIKGLGPCEGRA